MGDKVDLMVDGGVAVASVVLPDASAGLGILGVIVKQAVRAWLPDADEELQKGLQREVEDAVLTHMPELEKRITALEAKVNERPGALAVSQITQGFANSYVRAEGKKRKLVMNALRNAFDPDLYEASMTTRLLKIVDELDYPDLSYLMKTFTAPPEPPSPWRKPEDLGAYHASRLVQHGLVYRRNPAGVGKPDSPDDSALITGLGRLMIRLIREPKPVGEG